MCQLKSPLSLSALMCFRPLETSLYCITFRCFEIHFSRSSPPSSLSLLVIISLWYYHLSSTCNSCCCCFYPLQSQRNEPFSTMLSSFSRRPLQGQQPLPRSILRVNTLHRKSRKLISVTMIEQARPSPQAGDMQAYLIGDFTNAVSHDTKLSIRIRDTSQEATNHPLRNY